MRVCVFIPVCTALLLSACQPIVVRVGQRTQGTGVETSLPAAASSDIQGVQDWNTIEDFLQHLDEIKALGRDALVRRYHEDGRHEIRQVFRRFRDAVTEEAEREGLAPFPYLDALDGGACVPLTTQDIFGLEAFGDWKTLLETSFLSRIKPDETLPDAGGPGPMDTVTKLGFFELGLAMDGQSFHESSPGLEEQGSDLRWKVIHEQTEPEEWARLDGKGVIFRFLRRLETDLAHFSLEARVGEQVYEQNADGPLPGLWMDFEKLLNDAGAESQTMLLQTGLRNADGSWQRLQLSRRVIISQDLEQGHILHVAASEHWQKSEVIHKKFRLDLEARRLCSELGDL